MKSNLIILFLVCTQFLDAQTFTEVPSAPPFDGVVIGSIAFSDVNGDGSEDVLITGRNNANKRIAKLYTNDGLGNFTEMAGTPFDGVWAGAIAFSDVNGDGTEDVLIMGWNSSDERIAKLYINDGLGNFTEMMDTPFEGVWAGSMAFSDVNGDGSADVLIAGETDPFGNEYIAKLYTNDGLGNFTEITGTPFDGVVGASIAFSDVNGDGTNDVLITGRNSSDELIAKLYTNDGLGNFTEMMGIPLNGVRVGSIAFSDVNGDGTDDVLITGEKEILGERIAKLYTNDGLGNFTEMTSTPFEGVKLSPIAFSDVNGDGSNDVLITGQNNANEIITKLYTNDGLGNFTEMTGTPFDGVYAGDIAFSDVNGDGSEDVLITGAKDIFGNELITKLYTNDGLGNFTKMTGTSFDGVFTSSIAFSDVNGDGSEDVLITGRNNANERIAKLYTNDGLGNFTEMMDTPFDGVTAGSIAFSDVNGDGSEDVLVTGKNNSDEIIAKLYTNDGLGNFTEITGTPFDGVAAASIAFSDVNGNGFEDVLITGWDSSEVTIAKLYINDGIGNFTEMMGTPFDGVTAGSIAFSDVNGDGTNDVLITGSKELFGEGIAKLYTNDGLGNFTEILDTPFDGVRFGSIAFSDVNGDGSDDVLITGVNNSNVRIAKLYTNDGLGSFTEMMDTPFDGVWSRSIAFSDVNGDGSDDVLITGMNNSDVRIAKLYTNDGLGNFTEIMDTPFDGVSSSSIAFSDVNGDGSEDVLVTGKNNSDVRIAKLYINDAMVSSTDDLKFGMSLNFILFPNPSSSSTLFLSYTSTEMSEVSIKLYNVNGLLLIQQKEFAATGQQTYSVDISSLPKGNYLLELDNGKNRGIAKFIVQ